MKKTIYIFSSGQLHRKQNTLYFESEEGKRKYVPVENTKEIMIFGEVSLNKKLSEFLSQQEITGAKFVKLKVELKSIIEKEEDFIIFYQLRTKKYFAKETIGLTKGFEEQII
ncbi:CRISPR-associated endonuclease Cas1 [Candidatus Aerophobetes bacterium]|nr:CRISPR-associated endonuclease Cas1 [Candidatus Aerophobetes bacterium]